MTSEIRANTLKNRVGLGTVSFTNTGPVVSGIVTANTIRLADDNKIQLGDDQDLEILHDQSNGIIRSINSGGNMHVESKNHIELNVNYNPSSGSKENALKAIANQGVSLFYNGTQKLQTTNTGATVTGTLVATTLSGNISGGTVAGSTGTFTSNLAIGGNISIPDKIIHTDDTNTSIRFPTNDNISFEVGGVEKVRINSNGIAVTGAVEPTGHVKLDDDRFIYFGTGDDFIIGHQAGTPQNVFRSTDGATKMIFQGGSETMMVLHPQAQVELYYDNSKKLETTSVGTRLYGRTDIGDSTGGSTDDRLAFGDSQDLQIFHDGSTNRINASNGNLTIQAVTQHNIVLSYAGENMLVAKPDGAVELYYNATKRFETTSAGITVTGTVDSASDVILKENIKTIDNALDKVTKLRGVEYDYKDNKKHSIGVIAQEVEEVLPELVNGSEQKSVAYGNIAAVLIEAIKEQNVVINKMKKEIEDLKG